jgi:hypothetical protein
VIHSYSNIYNLGHAAIAELLKGPVIVEEKIDGSQFSFAKIDGNIRCRSKGSELNIVAPEKMFKKGVEVVIELSSIPEGFVFRSEYLKVPKHNVLAYDRIPKNHIIVYDIEKTGNQDFLSTVEKREIASQLGFETVPVLFEGMITDIEQFRKLLDTESCLGGQKIEGVVIKPAKYDLFGRDKKVLMGKFVSEEFRETHGKEWKAEHGRKSTANIIEILASTVATPARWQKAVIHLDERGELEHDPRDIGKLMAETQIDVEKECKELITEKLYQWAWPQLRRKCTRGLPEWYKEQLLKRQFEEDPE